MRRIAEERRKRASDERCSRRGMRRAVLASTLLALLLESAIASAKLPFFGLEVDPFRPRVGEPITLTKTCYADLDHSRPEASCFGAGGRMAWVHPLDEEGKLDRDDWIDVEGHATSGGATRGRITLHEPGAYDVLPLWRTWGRSAGRVPRRHPDRGDGRRAAHPGRDRRLRCGWGVARRGRMESSTS